jgi:hypothetical protein
MFELSRAKIAASSLSELRLLQRPLDYHPERIIVLSTRLERGRSFSVEWTLAGN